MRKKIIQQQGTELQDVTSDFVLQFFLQANSGMKYNVQKVVCCVQLQLILWAIIQVETY
jgi:hypothetical protein